MSFIRRITVICNQVISRGATAGSHRSAPERRRPTGGRFRYELLERRTMFAAGDLDTTFSTDGMLRVIDAGTDARGTAVAVQSDGKTVVVGTDQRLDGNAIFVVRLTTEGTLDRTFSGDGRQIISFGSTREDMGTDVKILSNGDILIAGSSISENSGQADFALARLNSDGSLDNGFSGDGKTLINFGDDDIGNKIAIDANGKIVMVGTTFKSGGGDVAIARLTSSGTPDTSFSGDGKKIVDTSGAGKIDTVEAFTLAPNGKYIIGCTTIASVSGDWQVNWFHTSGNLYRTKRITQGGDDVLSDLVMTPGGVITLVGSTTSGGLTAPAVARLNSTGFYDVDFDGDFNGNGRFHLDTFGSTDVSGRSISLTSGGKILIGGSALVGGDFDFALARLNADGTLDTSFSTDGVRTKSFPNFGSSYPNDLLNEIVVLGNKVILVGTTTFFGEGGQIGVMQLLLT